MMNRNLLITGGAGFIGRHVVKHFLLKYPHYSCFILDNLTYAGNLKNLKTVAHYPNFKFIKADINDYEQVYEIIAKNKIEGIIHLAAETHVDYSIQNPTLFTQTNILGTANLIEAFRIYLNQNNVIHPRYLQISTDEVFGSINYPLQFNENSPYRPKSPYSSSKAAADHLVSSYYNTYQFPALISYSTNNFGSHQYPEKLIPSIISKAIQKKPLPIYGTGQQIRDWISVKDHVLAIDLIFHLGKIGNTYAISAHNEYSNLEIVKKICRYLELALNYPTNELIHLITHVEDRPGHDFRYALNSSKLRNTLHWNPVDDFQSSLEATIHWYLNHPDWFNK